MTHNLRKTIEDIWKEAYAEHGRRQDDAVRAAIEEEEAELIPHEDVVARLEATFGRPIAEHEAPDMTDAEWDALQHHLEVKQYRETFAKIQADFTAARAFDTAQLNLAITPTCVFALYVAARRSSTVEEFETISREMAKICEYDR